MQKVGHTQTLEMHKAWNSGTKSMAELGREYGVSRETVRSILKHIASVGVPTLTVPQWRAKHFKNHAAWLRSKLIRQK